MKMQRCERWTDRARRVIALADHESRRMGHDYIGTEHILMAIVKGRETGIASTVLKNLIGCHCKIEAELNRLLATFEKQTLSKDAQSSRSSSGRPTCMSD